MQGEDAEDARRARQRDLRAHHRVGRRGLRRRLRGDGGAARRCRPSTRAASTCSLFDPLDGSSNIDVNVAVGRIFSILRAPDPGDDPADADFLQPGTEQVARGLRDLRAVHDARAHRRPRRRRLHARPRARRLLPHAPRHPRPEASACEFAINASNSRFWEAPVKRYVEECLAGATGPARQGLQHALDRQPRGRDAPHPHARRRLPLPARHARTARPGPAAAALRVQPDRHDRRAGRRARAHRRAAGARGASPRRCTSASASSSARPRRSSSSSATTPRPPAEPDAETPLFNQRGLFRQAAAP